MDHSVTVRTVTLVSVCQHNDGQMSLCFCDSGGDITAYLTSEQVDVLLAQIEKRRADRFRQTPAEVRADKDALRCQDMPDGDYGEREE